MRGWNTRLAEALGVAGAPPASMILAPAAFPAGAAACAVVVSASPVANAASGTSARPMGLKVMATSVLDTGRRRPVNAQPNLRSNSRASGQAHALLLLYPADTQRATGRLGYRK